MVKNKFMLAVSTFAGLSLLTGLALVLGWFWQGFVFVKLWSWFIAPTFGLVTPQYAVACGIIVLWRFLTGWGGSNKKPEGFWNTMAVNFLYGLIFLALGWTITFFI